MYTNFMSSGGYTFPPPVQYGVDYEDIDSENSTRNEQARLHRDRLRAEVTKIKVSWKLTPEQLAAVATRLRPKEFSLTFWNATTAQRETKTMYCSRKSSELLKNDADPLEQYWLYSADIIEC